MGPKQAIRRNTAILLSRLPMRGLDYLDAIFQEAQGKGWGYAGVNNEVQGVRTALELEGWGPPALVLDVGANVGDWSAVARRAWPDATIICFEPSSTAAKALRKRFEGASGVRVIESAVGSEVGEAVLFGNGSGSPLASLRKRRLDHFNVELGREETVRVLSLDAFLAREAIENAVDVVKIDVEGFEMDVLEGFADGLDSVKAVQFEWGEASTGSPVHWVDFFYFWRDRGLNLYRVSPRGVVQVDRYHPRDEVMTWTNYIAVRPGPSV